MRLPWKISPAAVLAVVFASLYLAVGPGCFFSVDEVVVQEMAQGLCRNGTLEVPPISGVRLGTGNAYYTHRGPTLGYAAVPFEALGEFLDNHFGSMSGSAAVGPPLGTNEHPLRWGGRFSIFCVLMVNAIAGGLIVATIYLVGLSLGGSPRAAMLMAIMAGISTTIASEATHFFGHSLEALALLTAFWFFSSLDRETMIRRAWLGSAAVGLAFLSRPNSALAAAAIWMYGAARVWKSEPGGRKKLLRPAVLLFAPAVFCGILYLRYNYVQFGSPFDFGYDAAQERFAFHFVHAAHVLASYLFSPGLSIFVFAPPLVLAIPSVRQALRRWPWETATLLAAAFLEMLVITSYGSWDGAVAYGPRFVLAAIVLLIPLTLPAIERMLQPGAWGWRSAAAALFAAGAAVQLLGISVYVTVNEWYRMPRNLIENSGWVFSPSGSPVAIHLKNLMAGQNLIPWFLRAWKASAAAPLLFWCVLMAIVLGGGVCLAKRFASRRADTRSEIAESSRLPEMVTVALLVLVFGGSAMTRHVMNPPSARVYDLLDEGIKAQRQGRTVAAEEDYALILGLESSNKFALYNMGLLYDQAGYRDRAVDLYQRSLDQDAGFAPARAGLLRLGVNAAAAPDNAASTAGARCNSSAECNEAGNRLWQAGSKAEALKIWDAAAKQYPSESSFPRSIAFGRYSLGDFSGAVRDYQRALALAPNETGIRTDLAWALLAAGRFPEARSICLEVLARDPGNAAAKAVLSRVDGAQKTAK